MEYTVKEVSSPEEFKLFYQFQNKLYADCKAYVPSLDFDQKDALSKSPCLDYCKQKLLLAYDGKGRVAGRCCAIINLRYNILYNTRRMRFGWTDFINDYDAFKALMDAAVEWGRSEGMTEIHGPLGYNTMYKQGMVVEGFDNVPQANNLYNASYYPEFVERYGFRKENDWVQFRVDGQSGVPERLERLSKAVMERNHLHIVKVTRFCRMKGAVSRFFEQYNAAFTGRVHNFIPFTEKEIKMEGSNYIHKLRNDLSCIILDENDDVAAFGICLGDMSPALKKANGSLWPFGWYHLWRSQRHYKDIDMMLLGSNPKYNGKGVSAVLFAELSRIFKKNKVRYCISNPQFEDNPAIKVWDLYPSKEPYIRRRCYIMSI